MPRRWRGCAIPRTERLCDCGPPQFSFEKALGRRAAWALLYGTHKLKILPHAFRYANAFYSRRDEALMFRFFQSERRAKQTVFTCLSRDVVAHETTHALLDGLLPEIDRPSSHDQGTFHEGFSDVVALPSVLSPQELLERARTPAKLSSPKGMVDRDAAIDALKKTTFLLGLAEEFDVATRALAGDALRSSIDISATKTLIDSDRYQKVPDQANFSSAWCCAPISPSGAPGCAIFAPTASASMFKLGAWRRKAPPPPNICSAS